MKMILGGIHDNHIPRMSINLRVTRYLCQVKKGRVDLKQSAGKVLDTMFMIYTVPQIGVYVRVCVCVCLYSFTIKASSVCDDAWDIPEYTDQRSCVVKYYSRFLYQVPSSPFLKISYFTSKNKTRASQQTGEKTI